MTPNSKILIVGANFAGLEAARALSGKHHVKVIDPREYFQWTPNIHEIVSGAKNSKSVEIRLGQLLARQGHKYIKDRVIGIDPLTGTVALGTGKTLAYDSILIAAGGGAPKSIGSEAWHKTGSTQDLTALRVQLQRSLQDDDTTLHVNIAGGGFTGVEILGELLRSYRSRKHLQINLIHKAHRLVADLPSEVSREILKLCRDLPVKFHLGTEVTDAAEGKLYLDNGTSLTSGINILCTGCRKPLLLNTSASSTTHSRGIAVNPYLQHKQCENIFVAGDIATLDAGLAKQASAALDMGRHAAKNMMRFMAGETLKPFKYQQKPVLLSFGDITTFCIYRDRVVSSPLLLNVKEFIYQYNMLDVSRGLSSGKALSSALARVSCATRKHLAPQILHFNPQKIISRSSVLKLRTR